MPFLPPNQQRQSTEGKALKALRWPGYLLEIGQAAFVGTLQLSGNFQRSSNDYVIDQLVCYKLIAEF